MIVARFAAPPRGTFVWLLHLLILLAVLLLPFGAAAQQPDPGGEIVGFVCSHQGPVSGLLTLLLIHFGCSTVSAIGKKLGLQDSPLFALVRLAALDLKPAAAASAAAPPITPSAPQ